MVTSLLWLVVIGEVPAQDFTYTTNGSITITGYTGPGGVVTIPDTITGLPVTVIGEWAFYHRTNVTSVIIPPGVARLGKYAFFDCEQLTAVSLPESLTNIGEHTFAYCTSLTGMSIPDHVTSIGRSVFNACISLSTVTLPDSLTSIGDAAFGGSGLASIAIPGTVTNIGEYAFGECTNLTGIQVSIANPTYSSQGGVLFDKNLTTLIQYPAGRTGTYTIPDIVTNIGYAAFVGAAGLSGVTIPDSVRKIGDSAFASCTSLASATLPDSITGIGYAAFYECSSLTNVMIPDSVSSIGGSAFAHCTSLVDITLPRSVVAILDYAFGYCSNLAGVYLQGEFPGTGSGVFYADNQVKVYYLPGTSLSWPIWQGRPTVLWNPQAQTADGGFGVRENRFGFNIAGTESIPLVIETSTNLAARGWVPLQACTLTNGLVHFGDAQWTNYPSRFYRIRSP